MLYVGQVELKPPLKAVMGHSSNMNYGSEARGLACRRRLAFAGVACLDLTLQQIPREDHDSCFLVLELLTGPLP